MNIGTSLYLYLPWIKSAGLAAVLLYMFKKLYNCYNLYDEKSELSPGVDDSELLNIKLAREAKKGAAALVVALLVGFTMFFSFGKGEKPKYITPPAGQVEMLQKAPEIKIESKSVIATPHETVEEVANQDALKAAEEENRKYLENLTKGKE